MEDMSGPHTSRPSQDLEPSRIPGLAKGIASNFMQVFFKAHDPLLACAEAG